MIVVMAMLKSSGLLIRRRISEPGSERRFCAQSTAAYLRRKQAAIAQEVWPASAAAEAGRGLRQPVAWSGAERSLPRASWPKAEPASFRDKSGVPDGRVVGRREVAAYAAATARSVARGERQAPSG